MRTSVLTQENNLDLVKVLPDIFFAAKHIGLSVNAFRLWFLGKHFDTAGCGFIPKKEFRAYIEGQGLSFYPYLSDSKNIGIIQELKDSNDRKIIGLVGIAKAANIACVERLSTSRWALIPEIRFISRDWMCWVWAGFIAQHNKLISRETLEKITYVPRRTQIRWEGKAKVRNIENFADYGRPLDSPLEAISLSYLDGVYGKSGRLRKRLPNSRQTTEVLVGNKGRIRRTRAALSNVGGSRTPVQRLYCKSVNDVREAKKYSRKRSNPTREQTDYFYELITVVDGKGVWEALKYD